jgi:hypothetical protein
VLDAAQVQIPGQAATQLGCFTTRQALDAGWTRRQLDDAAGASLTKVRHGVWVETAVRQAADDRLRHAMTVQAELLVLGPRWYAARRSAAVLSGLPLIGAPPLRAQLLAEPRYRAERSNVRHRQLAPLPTSERGTALTVPCTMAHRTAMDLARREPFRNGVVVADAVLREGVDRRWLLAALAPMKGWPGVERARRVAEFADGLAESPLESISRVAIHELGLPAPELQVEVWLGDRFLGRVDKLWRQFNTVGEADGFGKYGADPAASFKLSKVREDWLEDVGLEVARWGWDEAWRPAGVLDRRLERAFARGVRQQLDPRVRFVPTTVVEGLRRSA